MDSGLLLEFSACGREEILTRLGHTLGNGPGSGIPAFPERAPGVRQEELQASSRTAIQQKPCADFGGVQGWTRRAQKYPAGSGRIRLDVESTLISHPGSAFHQPQKPPGATAVSVRCSMWASSAPGCPSRR